MSNYEAILNLSPERMESFLDQVYLAGLNIGGHAARVDEEQEIELLGINPFDMAWLNEPAEPALTSTEEEYVLTGLTAAIFRILENQQPKGVEAVAPTE